MRKSVTQSVDDLHFRLPPRSPRDPRLISLRGLPSAGSVGSHSPEMVIRRLARPTPPSELPCGSLSRPFPKVSVHPSGCLCSLPRNRPACDQVSSFQFQVSLLRSRSCRPTGCLRQATQPAPAGMCSSFCFLPPLFRVYGLMHVRSASTAR